MKKWMFIIIAALCSLLLMASPFILSTADDMVAVHLATALFASAGLALAATIRQQVCMWLATVLALGLAGQTWREGSGRLHNQVVQWRERAMNVNAAANVPASHPATRP